MNKIEDNVKGKILIVEDDQKLAQVINLFLSKKGYLVQVCPDATKAIELLGVSKSKKVSKFFRPELMLVDIGLPGISGDEFMKILIKKRPEFYEIPFIFISGQFVEQEDILKGLTIGAFDYLCKPVDLNVLLLKVSNCIRFYRYIKEKGDKSASDHDVLDIKETAEYLRLTEKTVYTLVREGKIPALKIGGQWRFSKELLKKMLNYTKAD